MKCLQDEVYKNYQNGFKRLIKMCLQLIRKLFFFMSKQRYNKDEASCFQNPGTDPVEAITSMMAWDSDMLSKYSG